MRVEVLGASYEILDNQTVEDAPDLQKRCGLCEPYGRRILLRKMNPDADAPENLARYKRETLRHELVHAFLFESGLGACSDWAENEEIVDWIAIQFPKLAKTFAAAGCAVE